MTFEQLEKLSENSLQNERLSELEERYTISNLKRDVSKGSNFLDFQCKDNKKMVLNDIIDILNNSKYKCCNAFHISSQKFCEDDILDLRGLYIPSEEALGSNTPRFIRFIDTIGVVKVIVDKSKSYNCNLYSETGRLKFMFVDSDGKPMEYMDVNSCVKVDYHIKINTNTNKTNELEECKRNLVGNVILEVLSDGVSIDIQEAKNIQTLKLLISTYRLDQIELDIDLASKTQVVFRTSNTMIKTLSKNLDKFSLGLMTSLKSFQLVLDYKECKQYESALDFIKFLISEVSGWRPHISRTTKDKLIALENKIAGKSTHSKPIKKSPKFNYQNKTANEINKAVDEVERMHKMGRIT